MYMTWKSNKRWPTERHIISKKKKGGQQNTWSRKIIIAGMKHKQFHPMIWFWLKFMNYPSVDDESELTSLGSDSRSGPCI